MADLGDLVSRLEAVTSRLEKVAVGGAKASTADDDDDAYFDSMEAVTDFEDVLKNADNVVTIADNLPNDVLEMSKLLKAVCEASKQFLRVTVRAKTPTPADLQLVVKPLNDAIVKVAEYRQNNRASRQFNHLSEVSEAIGAFGWVMVPTRPVDYMAEMIGAADFYGNRVLKDYKDTPGHKEWNVAIKKLFNSLKTYVTANHKGGVQWNHNGDNATDVMAKLSKGGGAPKAPKAPSAPAAPPPPPPGAVKSKPKAAAVVRPDTGGLFAALNKGSAVTAGLKKVTDDQKTHKNPSLRGSSVVKSEDINRNKKSAVAPKQAVAVKKPPKLQLDGKKWSCEYQSGVQDIVIDAAVTQSLYVFKCDNSVITVKGKINSVTLDNCKKCGIIVDTLVASLDVVNCTSVKVQVNDKAPIVNIDKTDGCQVYIQKSTGLDTEFVTAKSSEVNICLVEANGEYTESFIAEQFLTKYIDGKFVTELYEVVG